MSKNIFIGISLAVVLFLNVRSLRAQVTGAFKVEAQIGKSLSAQDIKSGGWGTSNNNFHVPKQVFLLELTVTNTTHSEQKFTEMACSWWTSWEFDSPGIDNLIWGCRSNTLAQVPLAAGASVHQTLPVYITSAAPSGIFTFSIAYKPYSESAGNVLLNPVHPQNNQTVSQQIFWSNPIQITVPK